MLKLSSVYKFLFLVFVLALSSQSMAAAIHHCNKSQKRCIVQLNEGQKNDRVRVIDDGAHLIDTGKIILVQKLKNGKGSYAVIELARTKKERREIHRGYPVIVELEHEKSHMIWAPQINGQK